MNETTFENAKVGDRVWDARAGWGMIISREEEEGVEYPLMVMFKHHPSSFTNNGRIDHWALRTLFWDEIKFEAPPRPVRKIKKVMEGWVNIYDKPEAANEYTVGRHIHLTKEGALRYLGSVKSVGEPLFIHHEYEVEE